MAGIFPGADFSLVAERLSLEAALMFRSTCLIRFSVFQKLALPERQTSL
jgi:hypothetical protein